MFLLILPYAIQIAFIIHAIRNGKNTTWIWLLIMIPFVGGIIYFFMEVVPDLRRGRLVDTDAAMRLVNKSAGVKKLRERVKISNTVANNIELADEYFFIGNYDEAIEIYLSQLKGLYENDRSLQVKIARAAFLKADYALARQYFSLAENQSRSTATDLRLYLRYSDFMVEKTHEKIVPVKELFEITRDCEVGWYLIRGLAQLEPAADVGEVLEIMGIQSKNSRGRARTRNRSFLKRAKALIAEKKT